MSNLSTTYLGLQVKTPVVVSSSGLTDSVKKIKQLEEYGVGAVVLKSLFEEQIKFEAGKLAESSNYPEAQDYVNYYTKANSVDAYLKLISDSKKETSIPIIASINCVSASEWIDFAKKIEEAGADAIELNVFYLPTNKSTQPGTLEKLYFDVAAGVIDKVNIPVSVKLGTNFSNVLYVVDQLYYRGVKGVVLFNRFYAPDIDINGMKITVSEIFSGSSDIRQSLRWVGIVSSEIKQVDIAASTGIHDGIAVAKQILAGAQVAQVCSTIYKNGIVQIKTINEQLKKWMSDNEYETIEDFRGKLNYSSIPDPALYERSQFMKYFSGHQY